MPGEPGPQVVGSGQDQGPGLVDRPGTFSCGAAPGDHQRADRLHGAVPALRRAAGPAGLGGPGSADRVQRVGLALPAPVLAVRAVHLDDPDAGGCHVPGQARAVAAGPLDPDQGDGPEPGQPAQQPGIAARRSGELPDTEQPADRVQRGGDVHVGMGIHPAGDGACLYNGHSHPFHRLRDGTHPLAVGPVKPWPLIQARQIRPAAPVGARKTGTRPTDRFARQPERRQPIRRSGRDPGSRRYAPATSRSGKPRRKHYPHSPCRLRAFDSNR